MKKGVAGAADKKKVLGGLAEKMMPLKHGVSEDEASEEEDGKGKKKKGTGRKRKSETGTGDGTEKPKKVKTEEVGITSGLYKDIDLTITLLSRRLQKPLW